LRECQHAAASAAITHGPGLAGAVVHVDESLEQKRRAPSCVVGVRTGGTAPHDPAHRPPAPSRHCRRSSAQFRAFGRVQTAPRRLRAQTQFPSPPPRNEKDRRCGQRAVL